LVSRWPPVMRRSEADRLRAIASVLDRLAAHLDEAHVDGSQLDTAIAELKGLRHRRFGTPRREGSARQRIHAYLVAHVGEPVQGVELAEIAGISEWARRVRELREEGLALRELGGSVYVLDELPEA
jgi:hypothetical protein